MERCRTYKDQGGKKDNKNDLFGYTEFNRK